MRVALHGCLRCRSFCSECEEVPNGPAHIACCDAEEAFSKRLTVRSGLQSVLGSRSQLACSTRLDCVQSIHVRGWRGLDQTQPGLRHFQPGALFRFIAGESPNVQVVPTTEIFRTSRRRARGTGKSRACGGWPRSGTSRAKPRLLLYPTFPATVGRLRLLGLLRDARHRPRSLRSAALEVRRLIDRFRSQQREFLSVLIVAVLARSQRHSKESRGAVAQASSMVIPVGH